MIDMDPPPLPASFCFIYIGVFIALAFCLELNINQTIYKPNPNDTKPKDVHVICESTSACSKLELREIKMCKIKRIINCESKGRSYMIKRINKAIQFGKRKGLVFFQ